MAGASAPRGSGGLRGALCLASALQVGCAVHVYQPLSGLHQPVLIDPSVANFQDLNLAIYCPPGDHLDGGEAGALCRKVGVLFENQGAVVTTATRDRRLADEAPPPGEPGEEAAPRADLVLELRTTELRTANDPVSWLLCWGTFTLVPAVTESIFTQEVIIRDGSGFLLESRSLRGRIVRSFGLGTWLGNKALDLVWRDKEDELTGDVAKRELSADLYQQLSQLVFNAKMRSQVLSEVPGLPGLDLR